jgi:hypothetical protein
MTSIDFYLNSEFLTTATGLTAGTVTSGATTDNTTLYDCKAGCNITLATAQSLFQFQTDSLDMNDTAKDDILYKLNYTTSTTPLTSDFITNTIMTNGGISIANATKNIPNDFLGYVANAIFGTPKGVDLFTNEETVLASIQTQSVAAFNTKLLELAGHGALTYTDLPVDLTATPRTIGTTAVVNGNPSKKIFDHIMTSQNTRFADITSYEIDSTGWFKMPILVGDSINFVLSITSPNDRSITGSTTAITNRRYQIKMTVVA